MARRRTPEVFGRKPQHGSKERDPLPLIFLLPIVKHCQPQIWHDDLRDAQVKALEATLRQGIDKLAGKFGKIPGKDEVDNRISNEEAALRYFNLDGSGKLAHIRKIDVDDVEYEDKGTKGYEKILSVFRDVSGVYEGSTLSGKLRELCRKLAVVLIDLAYGPNVTNGRPAVPSLINKQAHKPAAHVCDRIGSI